MACYRPLKAFRTSSGVSFVERGDVIESLELPCGQCIGCRMRRASDWEIRIMHEASLHERSCFVTLTYSDAHLPADGSLRYRDFQLFMKRLRRRFGPDVRFYMCGEYGETTRRPHYHACLFGVWFEDQVPIGKSKSGFVFHDSAVLRDLWRMGHVSVQELVRETAGYCARYIMKKVLGPSSEEAYRVVSPDGEVIQLRPEFAVMSRRPGIGAGWLAKFARDVYPMDGVVVDGSVRQVPRAYDRLFKRAGGDFEDVEFERFKRGQLTMADNTPERRAVREKVHSARVSKFKRSL